MSTNIINLNAGKIAEDYYEAWQVYRDTNDWGSGEDSLWQYMAEIEEEWIAEQLFLDGYAEYFISEVMDHLGYTYDY